MQRPDLRYARKAAGLTQTELAVMLGKEQPVISRYERGHSAIDVATAPKIAAILKIPLLQVLYGPSYKRVA